MKILFLFISLALFANSREADLRVILEQTYLASHSEPVLEMLATEVIAEEKRELDPHDLIQAFRAQFHDEKMQKALAAPYAEGFSDEEIGELKKICENPVWQKYALSGAAIFLSHFQSMKAKFQELAMPIADIMEITQDNIGDLIQMNRPFIIEVRASWCGACKTMAPVFEEMSLQYQDQIQFAQVDIDAQEKLAKKLGVHSLPTTLFFKAGASSPMMKQVGAMDREEFEQQIQKFLKKQK